MLCTLTLWMVTKLWYFWYSFVHVNVTLYTLLVYMWLLNHFALYCFLQHLQCQCRLFQDIWPNLPITLLLPPMMTCLINKLNAINSQLCMSCNCIHVCCQTGLYNLQHYDPKLTVLSLHMSFNRVTCSCSNQLLYTHAIVMDVKQTLRIACCKTWSLSIKCVWCP